MAGAAQHSDETRGTLNLQLGELVAVAEGTVGAEIPGPVVPLLNYVRTLPALRRGAYANARPEWDSGVTGRMVEATYQVIDVFQEALVTLAAYYPAGHFDRDDPRDYFSELIATRFRWHRYHAEPHGKGRNGTIVHTMVAGSVLADVEQMVKDMVVSLMLDWSVPEEDDLFNVWRAEWDDTGYNVG
jgi:hypothetical protein